MPMVKIIARWDNTENWEIGQVVDITNPWTLIKEGRVILLDEKGNEISQPGVALKCPVCTYEGYSPFVYARHILTHEIKEEKKIEVTSVMEERIDKIVEEMKDSPAVVAPVKKTPEEMRAFRIENLRKAREAKKAKV